MGRFHGLLQNNIGNASGVGKTAACVFYYYSKGIGMLGIVQEAGEPCVRGSVADLGGTGFGTELQVGEIPAAIAASL